MATADQIVTPEAVVLELATAGVASRLVAKLLDSAIQGAALLLILMAAGFAGFVVDGWIALVVVIALVFGILFGYSIVMETLTRGRTVGKMAVGLRVVTVEGGPISFRHAAIRAFLGLVDFFLSSGSAAVLCVIATPRDQRLGDLVAGTVVVRERRAWQAPAVLAFPVPPGLESYVAGLDVSSVTSDQYLVLRRFAQRTDELAPGAHAVLLARLANSLAAQLHHTPPSWMRADVFCACVAAAYRLRSQAQDAARTGSTGGGPPGSGRPPGSAQPPGMLAPPWQPRPSPSGFAPPAPPPAPTRGAPLPPPGPGGAR